MAISLNNISYWEIVKYSLIFWGISIGLSVLLIVYLCVIKILKKYLLKIIARLISSLLLDRLSCYTHNKSTQNRLYRFLFLLFEMIEKVTCFSLSIMLVLLLFKWTINNDDFSYATLTVLVFLSIAIIGPQLIKLIRDFIILSRMFVDIGDKIEFEGVKYTVTDIDTRYYYAEDENKTKTVILNINYLHSKKIIKEKDIKEINTNTELEIDVCSKTASEPLLYSSSSDNMATSYSNNNEEY